MNAKLTFIHALSPLHAGTGQGVGVIDLPIAREKATGIPFLPGSSLKGPLRDLCSDSTDAEKQRKKAVFGPETSAASDHAGMAQFSDLRLLLLPVRSLKGTFAWVTSPYLLQRLVRDAKSIEANAVCPSIAISVTGKQCAVVKEASVLKYEGNKVILEDLDLEADEALDAGKWAEWIGERAFGTDKDLPEMLKARLCIVADDVMNFLLGTATEITARIRLDDEKKTVVQGQLWYEEALPAETILSGLLVATAVKATNQEKKVVKEVIDEILAAHNPVQLGGKATVGRGVCYVRLASVTVVQAQGGTK